MAQTDRCINERWWATISIFIPRSVSLWRSNSPASGTARDLLTRKTSASELFCLLSPSLCTVMLSHRIKECYFSHLLSDPLSTTCDRQLWLFEVLHVICHVTRPSHSKNLWPLFKLSHIYASLLANLIAIRHGFPDYMQIRGSSTPVQKVVVMHLKLCGINTRRRIMCTLAFYLYR